MSVKRSPLPSQSKQTPANDYQEELKTPRRINKRTAEKKDESSDEELQNKPKNQKFDEDTSQPSLKDILNQLKSSEAAIKSEIRNDIEVLRKDVTYQIGELKGSLDAVKTEVSDLSVKVNGLETRIDEVTSIANENSKLIGSYNNIQFERNTKAINYLKQKELQNKIDIVGAKWPETMEGKNIKEEVKKLMRKYNVDMDVSLIKAAYIRKVNSLNIKVMVVEFLDFETKIRILKEKRQSKIRDGIFFDNSLTPLNGKLMSSSRKIAKEKNFKTYLNNNKICIKKSNVEVKWIESESDLEIVKLWVPNPNPNAQNNATQASSSSINLIVSSTA
ncbi:hypothetical protein ACKWTF_008424 [Chironomus riparius]